MRGIPWAAEETLASQLGYHSIELVVYENSRKDSSCSDTDFLTSEYYSAAYSTFVTLHHNRKLNVNAIQPPSQTLLEVHWWKDVIAPCARTNKHAHKGCCKSSGKNTTGTCIHRSVKQGWENTEDPISNSQSCIYFLSRTCYYAVICLMTLLERQRSQRGIRQCCENQQEWQCTYNVASWSVRVMFIPPWLSLQLDTISLDTSTFMSIYFRRQQ
jgi:hypothetical protein